MDPIRRNERLVAMTNMLVGKPNQSFALSEFCSLFGVAKSTVSEDLDLIRGTLHRFGLGSLETQHGAAGGAKFCPYVGHKTGYEQVLAFCKRLESPGRILPGGLLYLADIIADPQVIARMGMIVASEFARVSPDFVLTMETQGIPLAMMTGNALGIPVIVARRSSKAYEGPAVHINYLVGTQFETMSLARRLVKPGQRALLIDDVLRSGGTASGMYALMREFSAEVVGASVLVSTEEALLKFREIKPLMILESTDTPDGSAKLRPGDWLKN